MSAGAKLGVAVIGAGVVGRMRARTVSRHPACSLVAIADVDDGRAREAARGTPAVVVGDYRRALEVPGVDVAIVSTPGHEHEPMVIRALQSGRHVLCEKPLGIHADSCRRMVSAAAGAKRTLAVGFNHRYYPCVKQLRAVLESGRLGKIDHVRALGGHQGLGEFRAEWMYKSETSGGGAMMDVGIHLTDLVQFVAGEIVEVTALVTNGVWSVAGSEDNALALMKTAGGAPVRYQATWSEWKGYRLSLEVYGQHGMAGAYYAPMMNFVVTTDEVSKKRTRRLDLHPRINVREKLRGWQTTAEAAFTDELTDFVRVIHGEASLIADGAAGYRAVAVAEAAYQSSRIGAAVRVPPCG